MSELLLEVRGDGFPRAEIESACQQLKDLLVADLREAGLPARQSATGCSTLRLMVLLRGIPDGKPEDDDRRKGLVGRAIEDSLSAVKWRNSVSWQGGFRWGAPVTGILALLDGRVVPAAALGVETSSSSQGPATSGRRRFTPANGEDYGRHLVKNGVEIRLAGRLHRLQRSAQEAAAQLGLEVVDSDLLGDWAAACETPSLVVCRLDEQAADLPGEIVAACLAERQGALPLLLADGSLSQHFLAIADRVDEHAERAAVGNERAARDHIEDARFHFQRDARTPLAKRVRLLSDGLEARQAGYGERSRRLEVLCTFLARELGSADQLDASVQAAGLLYADRQTETVREFPKLAGVVGGLLARDEGYPASVWQAIYDTGQPRSLPRSRAGEILFVADRVDRLVESVAERDSLPSLGFYEREDAGEVARGLVSTVQRARLELDLTLSIAQSVRQRALEQPNEVLGRSLKEVEQAVRRLLEGDDCLAEEIDAVLLARGTSSIPTVFRRVLGLCSLRGDSRLQQISATARRMRDVLLESREEALRPELLEEPAEVELHQTWVAFEPKIRDALTTSRFDLWLDAMVALDSAAQTFLSRVLVHDANEALQRNRLALLQDLQRAYAGPLRLVELPS